MVATTLSINYTEMIGYALFIVSEVLGASPVRVNGIIDTIITGLRKSLSKKTIDEEIQETQVRREVV